MLKLKHSLLHTKNEPWRNVKKGERKKLFPFTTATATVDTIDGIIWPRRKLRCKFHVAQKNKILNYKKNSCFCFCYVYVRTEVWDVKIETRKERNCKNLGVERNCLIKDFSCYGVQHKCINKENKCWFSSAMKNGWNFTLPVWYFKVF